MQGGALRYLRRAAVDAYTKVPDVFVYWPGSWGLLINDVWQKGRVDCTAHPADHVLGTVFTLDQPGFLSLMLLLRANTPTTFVATSWNLRVNGAAEAHIQSDVLLRGGRLPARAVIVR